MNIDTIFDLQDEVYLMQENKVVCGTVNTMEIHIASDGLYHSAQPEIIYEISIPICGKLRVRKNIIFPSKEALLAGL